MADPSAPMPAKAAQAPVPKPAEPVRIKLYWIFTVTRAGYLMQQVIAIVCLLTVLGIWSTTPQVPEPSGDDSSPVPRATGVEHHAKEGSRTPGLPPEIQRLFWAMNQIPKLAMVLLLLVLVESVFVLRKFARKEAEQRAAASAGSPLSKPLPAPVEPPAGTPAAPSSGEQAPVAPSETGKA